MEAGYPVRLQGIGHIPYSASDAYYHEVCTYLGVPRVPTKEQVYQTFGYHPLPTIDAMHHSQATHRIVAGGNRSGKSEGGKWEIMPYLFWNSVGWVISANYALTDIIMDKLILELIEYGGHTRVRNPYDMSPFEFSYSPRDHRLQMWTGAVLEGKSCENPDSMHGKALDYAVIDEASLFPYTLYDTRVVPRLVDSGGWILSLGTFEWHSGEWFEEFFELGQVENNLGIASWHHPTEDNYHIFFAKGGEKPEDVAKMYRANATRVARSNPDVKWPLKVGTQVYIYNVDLDWLANERKRIDPVVYKARYEALPAANQAVVFPDWRVTEFAGAEARNRCSFDRSLPVYLAIDPGGTYAVAAIQLKRFEDSETYNEISKGYHVCVIDTLYFQTQTTTQEVFEVMKSRSWWPNVSRKVDWWDPFQGTIDVMAKEQQKAFRNIARSDSTIDRLSLRGRRVFINDGIKTLQHYLATRTFWSHPDNRYLHIEFKRYHWPEATVSNVDTRDPRRGQNPVNEWNHLLKAIWYFLVVKFGCYGRSRTSAVVSLDQLRRV